jgi:hypothetical protein
VLLAVMTNLTLDGTGCAARWDLLQQRRALVLTDAHGVSDTTTLAT